jgi:tellurite resistance protein TerC
VCLPTGLSVILAFIGVKLILAFLHEHEPSIPDVPTAVSLAVSLGVLAVTTGASVVAARRHPERRAHAGSVRGHHTRPADEPVAEPGGSG